MKRSSPWWARARGKLLRACLICWWADLVLAGPAFAQEFVKVEDGAREQLPSVPFVGIAYGFIWVAVLVYILVVGRGLTRVQSDLQDLRRRLDRADPAPGGSPGRLPDGLKEHR